jgi:hypothetical protein
VFKIIPFKVENQGITRIRTMDMSREKMETSRRRRKDGKVQGPRSHQPRSGPFAIRMTDWDNATYSNCPECQWSGSTSKGSSAGAGILIPNKISTGKGSLQGDPFRFSDTRLEQCEDEGVNRVLAENAIGEGVHPLSLFGSGLIDTVFPEFRGSFHQPAPANHLLF